MAKTEKTAKTATKEYGKKKIFITCLMVLAITACVEIIIECSGLIFPF